MENGRTITGLKVQKRNQNRINVYLDGDFSFGLARIVAAWLKVGDVLDQGKIDQLQKHDTLEIAYQRALNLLGTRARSRQEITARLVKSGFDQEAIDHVLTRLTENRLIDDEQFAMAWVDNRNTFRPRSHRMLAIELRHKGIPDPIIQKTIGGTEPETELAYRLSTQYARKISKFDLQEFKRRLSGYLVRRGFGYDIAGPMVQRVWEEMHEDRAGINLSENEDMNNE